MVTWGHQLAAEIEGAVPDWTADVEKVHVPYNMD